jgi:hypothetical protein
VWSKAIHVKVPSLPHRHFMIVSALVDGTDRTFDELCRALGKDLSRSSFMDAFWQLAARGFIVRVRFMGVVRQKHRRSYRRTFKAYRITDSGRAAWVETLDFYRFLSERFLKTAGRHGSTAVTTPKAKHGAQIERAVPRRLEPERRATSEESERLLKFAGPGFAYLYRALRESVLTFDQLAALEIGNIDFARQKLSIRPDDRRRVIRAGNRLLGILQSACGTRREGRVFLNSYGRPWQISRARATFARCRRLAGLPSSIVMRGRLKKGTRSPTAS